ncbi:MAG TPA: YeeE/YedE thiosulfate transporter family protein [Tahibacter sp.]|uniref:YeeE/YedE thiosulfate transporter family protein n=1 Tax=Tahibacter sp. TaxID=2056211 RepID=UPI002B7E9C35|nr:YeeE/YedE thiosulfate transporter family protein [Tahibacter sp.]HSX62252.1 YeeE/YedE thiosulfate transporter family protein [Tahibacter sp.]
MNAPLLTESAPLSATLAVALVVGIGFGFALERAGLGSARRLVAQFYGRDLRVLKVMFSALLVAMLGVFWLSRAGVLDLQALYVPPTWLLPQCVGGFVFGAGLIAAGLCPGTACVAAATGRIDGAFVLLGLFGGMLGCGLLLARWPGFYESTARGAWTLPELLDLPYGAVVAIVVAVALLAFVAAERIERRFA